MPLQFEGERLHALPPDVHRPYRRSPVANQLNSSGRQPPCLPRHEKRDPNGGGSQPAAAAGTHAGAHQAQAALRTAGAPITSLTS